MKMFQYIVSQVNCRTLLLAAVSLNDCYNSDFITGETKALDGGLEFLEEIH